MTELDRKIKELKDFIKQKTDQGTANYLGKEIREICGMVESEQLLIHGVVVPKGTLSCGCKEHLTITFTSEGDYCGNCGKLIPTT